MINAIEYVDLLVIGGGIAGIAVAERAAREAKRQGRAASIVVLEREPMLAMGASARLQGWFHSGALYCRLDSDESIRQCIESAQALARNYGPSSDFSTRNNCNVNVPTGPGDPAANWFGEPIDFLIDHPGKSTDQSKTQQMLDRIDMVWQHALKNPQPERRDHSSGMLRVQTPDREMRTFNIARDLTRAAESLGVQFYTGVELKLSSLADAAINGVTARIGSRVIQYIPKRTIATVGSCIANVPAIHSKEIALRSGIIVTVRSSVADTNFAVLADNPARNLSHITHGCTKSGKPNVYSAISDSTAIHPAATHEQCELIAKRIIQKAINHLGADAFRNRTFAWHACAKVEPIHPETNEVVFGPSHRDLDEAGLVTAIIPAKFSLFPKAAEHALGWLVENKFFASLSSAPQQTSMPAPIASPLSSALVGITPAQTSRLPSGQLMFAPQGK